MSDPAVEAVLQTGAMETRYRRAGAGVPVLLLFPRGLADVLGAELFTRLSTRYRVVAPVVPDGVGGAGIPRSTWLRALIDGLGLVQPTVVADETLAGALLGFSLVDPGRVGGVVAICRDDADPASSVGTLHAAHGLLVVAVDTASDAASSAEAAMTEIVRFVDGDAGA
jgi:hypothetical protein